MKEYSVKKTQDPEFNMKFRKYYNERFEEVHNEYYGDIEKRNLESQLLSKKWKNSRTAPTFWDKSEDPVYRSDLEKRNGTMGTAWGSPRVRYPRGRS